MNNNILELNGLSIEILKRLSFKKSFAAIIKSYIASF